MREHRRQLGTSQGVPEPHSFAVRNNRRSSVSAAASIASRPAFRDDAQRPSHRGGTACDIHLILASEKQNYFCRTGLTGICARRLSGKSICSRLDLPYPPIAKLNGHRETRDGPEAAVGQLLNSLVICACLPNQVRLAHSRSHRAGHKQKLCQGDLRV
jgi:hypothetical protein